MTTSNITASSLLGKFVSFTEIAFDQVYVHRGLIKSVCLNLEGDHEILIDNDFFKISEIHDLKITDVLS